MPFMEFGSQDDERIWKHWHFSKIRDLENTLKCMNN